MKILCLSTLDKFSRFYLDIERQLKTESESAIDLKIYSIYFSGFLYTFLRDKFSSWISLKAWFLARRRKEEYIHLIDETKIHKGVAYSSYINFHLGLNKNTSKQSLLLQALAYIDVFDEIFNKEQPDYIISIGDSRLCIEIAIAIAKQRNIKIYHIEQGPYNTTFFDDVGVNANLSIRNKSLNHTNPQEVSKTEINLKPNSKKYNRSPIYRGLDILFMKIFETTTIYPPDLKYTDLNSYRSKRSFTKVEHLSNTNKTSIALLILQVPLDVNMINHSPIYKNHSEIIESVYHSLPKGVELIVREHPLYINKYEKDVYAFIRKQHIIIDNSTSLNNALKMAKIVIVNNSTVGIEAILNYKTTVVLGNAFYDNDNICLKLKNKNEIKSVLKNALEYSPNKNEIDNFKHLLYTTVLKEGAITDKHLKSSKHIANQILANL